MSVLKYKGKAFGMSYKYSAMTLKMRENLLQELASSETGRSIPLMSIVDIVKDRSDVDPATAPYYLSAKVFIDILAVSAVNSVKVSAKCTAHGCGGTMEGRIDLSKTLESKGQPIPAEMDVAGYKMKLKPMSIEQYHELTTSGKVNQHAMILACTQAVKNKESGESFSIEEDHDAISDIIGNFEIGDDVIALAEALSIMPDVVLGETIECPDCGHTEELVYVGIRDIFF